METIDKAWLRNIFDKFYYMLLNDTYYHRFFSTYAQVNSLINDRQVEFFVKAYELLQKGQEQEVYKMCLSVAKIHTKINISAYFIFQGIQLLRNLMLEDIKINRVAFDQRVIQKLFEFIDETTVIEYLNAIFEEGLQLIKEDSEWQKVQKRMLVRLKDIVNNENCKDYSQLTSSMLCPLQNYIESLEFKVKTAIKKEDRFKFQLYHNNLHKIISDFIKLYKKNKYIECTLLAESIVHAVTYLNSMIEDIELFWKLHKGDSFSTYLMESRENFNLKIIPTKHSNSLMGYILNHLIEQLQEVYKDDKNVFIFEYKKRINFLYEGDNFDFDKLKRVINEYCSEKCALEEPVIKIACIEVSNLYREHLTPELVNEIAKIIEHKIDNLEAKASIFVKDYTTEFYSILEEAKENLHIRQMTLESIQAQKIELFAQDIFNLKTLESEGVEILARVKDVDGKFIPAVKFINVIIKENLEAEFDLAVLRQLISKLEKIESPRIFLNMFPSSFESKEVTEAIKFLAKRAVAMDKKIIVEITEYSLSDDLSILSLLDDKNIEVAFDDFGVGYTNFELVGMIASHSRANTLKIDGNLVKKIENKIHKSIIESISLFASENKLSVIYEFVENEDILKKLQHISQKLGLEAFGQGWYFSKPKPIDKDETL